MNIRLSLALLFVIGISSPAMAVPIDISGSTTGTFSGPSPGLVVNGAGTIVSVPDTGFLSGLTPNSALTFGGTAFGPGQGPTNLGALSGFNALLTSGPVAGSGTVTLNLNVSLTGPVAAAGNVPVTLTFNSTTNSLNPFTSADTWSITPTIVDIPTAHPFFNTYTVQILGFNPAGYAGAAFGPSGTTLAIFEGLVGQGQVYGIVTVNPEPASMLAWGLIVGVGAVGYRLRKRQSRAVAA